VKQVIYAADALNALKIYGNMRDRMTKAISEYAANQTAHANQVTPLVGQSAKRMRVGEFRVIFEETAAAITVTKIGPRGNVYK
jgi:mRNA interferase RelE/StbE